MIAANIVTTLALPVRHTPPLAMRLAKKALCRGIAPLGNDASVDDRCQIQATVRLQLESEPIGYASAVGDVDLRLVEARLVELVHPTRAFCEETDV